MMIHSTVEYQEFLSARFFYIDNASDINAGFTNQESSGFDDETSSSKMRILPHIVGRIGLIQPSAIGDVFLTAGLTGNEATVSTDQARRRTLYSEVQKIVAEDTPYVSLWYKTNVAVAQRTLSGIHLPPGCGLNIYSAFK